LFEGRSSRDVADPVDPSTRPDHVEPRSGEIDLGEGSVLEKKESVTSAKEY